MDLLDPVKPAAPGAPGVTDVGKAPFHPFASQTLQPLALRRRTRRRLFSTARRFSSGTSRQFRLRLSASLREYRCEGSSSRPTRWCRWRGSLCRPPLPRSPHRRPPLSDSPRIDHAIHHRVHVGHGRRGRSTRPTLPRCRGRSRARPCTPSGSARLSSSQCGCPGRSSRPTLRSTPACLSAVRSKRRSSSSVGFSTPCCSLSRRRRYSFQSSPVSRRTIDFMAASAPSLVTRMLDQGLSWRGDESSEVFGSHRQRLAAGRERSAGDSGR